MASLAPTTSIPPNAVPNGVNHPANVAALAAGAGRGGGLPQQMNNPAGLQRERIATLFQQINMLRSQGHTPENNPNLARMMQFAASIQQQQQQQQQQQGAGASRCLFIKHYRCTHHSHLSMDCF
jgi:hypothetical protein